MQSSRLRHRVEFQFQVETNDPVNNAPIIAWQTATANGVQLLSVPAEVLTGAGRELIASGTKLAETTARINVRWFPGLLVSWRVIWDGRIYDIQGLSTDITGRREWRLQCVDGLSDGK
jgi:head-tail adaptor